MESDNLQSDNLKQVILDALEEMKAVATTVLDVQALTDVMDTLIITSGTSSRHVKSIANLVSVKAKQAGYRPLGVEGEDAGEWVLVDFGDIVVHVMLPATREFYDLERLWVNPVTEA